MSSSILNCSYGSKPASLTALTPGKVKQLNQAGNFDIRSRVGRIVTRHLGYTGDDNYTVTLTKSKIDFSVGNQTRTLVRQPDGSWKLNNSAPATAPQLAQPNTQEIIDDIADILAKIRTLNTSEEPHGDPISPPLESRLSSVASNIDSLQDLSRMSSEQLTLHQRTNRLLEEILREVRDLRGLSAHHTHRDELEQQLSKLERTVEGIQKAALRQSQSQEKETSQQLSTAREQIAVHPNDLEEYKAQSTSELCSLSELLQGALEEIQAELQLQKEESKKALGAKELEITNLKREIEGLNAELEAGTKVLESSKKAQKRLRESLTNSGSHKESQ
jgi:DNA repair exonuclease SbcCD ATPase subunit